MAEPATGSKQLKRKQPSNEYFYAVKVGTRPGIYRSWEEMKDFVLHHKGSKYKKFKSEAEAQSFMEHGLNGPGTAKYYAVRYGHIPGVYDDLTACHRQVDGFKGALHKEFATKAQAEAFVNGLDDAGDHDGSSNPRAKKARKSEATAGQGEPEEKWAAGDGPMPDGAVDEFDSRIVLNPNSGNIEYKSSEQRSRSKMMPVGVQADQQLRIYTDGSSLKNGQIGAQAGVGVYFGPKDPRNVSEPLGGSRQTNQRAELTAVKRAIELAPRDRNVVIYTDSRYAISCCTEWFQNWRRNGWQTSDKKPVENRDLVEPIITAIDLRYRLKRTTTFEWVKGHASDPGNIAADELAVAGARGG